jgi:hypothetical protein
MMMLVIVALAGLFQLPPSRSVYCAIAVIDVSNNIETRHQADLKFFITLSPAWLIGKWYEIG